MQKIYDFVRGRDVVIITMTVVTLLLFGLVMLVLNEDELSIAGVVINVSILVFLVVFCWGDAPKRMIVTSDNLMIVRNFGRSVIVPRYKIKAVEAVEYKRLQLIRTFGNGGLFGYTGRYRSRTLGNITMFATEKEHLVCIKTDETCYLVSCRQTEDFIASMKAMINR